MAPSWEAKYTTQVVEPPVKTASMCRMVVDH